MKRLLPVLMFLSVMAFGGDALTQIGTIPLPGVTGRFDHFAVDGPGRRLFVAALGNNTVEVLDVTGRNRITSLRNFRKPTGVVFLPTSNQIGIAAGEDGVFKVFRGDDYKLAGSVQSLDDADNARFDSNGRRIYVGYGSGALAEIDLASLRQARTFKLPAHPESFQLEQKGRRIFINLPDAKQIAVLDREKGEVIATWPQKRFLANFPMALDEPGHRLFVGCRHPPRLLVLETESGTQTADIGISGDTDDLFYDADRRRAYISCGEGFIDVIGAVPGEALRLIQKLSTRDGARTSWFSADLDQLYLAVPNRFGKAAELRIYKPSEP